MTVTAWNSIITFSNKIEVKMSVNLKHKFMKKVKYAT